LTDPLPAPLVAPDTDLRDFPFMPLFVARLRDSDFAARASGDEFRAGIFLLSAAWCQLPAASVPDDDVVLSQLAGYGRAVKEWRSVRAGALHGFVKCADGRLYHPVLAEVANASWQKKLVARWKRECDRIRKENEGRKEKGLPALEMPSKPADPQQNGSAVSAGAPIHSDGIPAETATPSVGFPAEPAHPSDGSAAEYAEAFRGKSDGNQRQGRGRETEEKESSSSVPRFPAQDDDDLRAKLKKAANGNIAPGCANLMPIRRLLAEGCDLELDVLAYFAARVFKLKRPLDNFGNYWLVPEIRAWSRDRRAGAELATSRDAPALLPKQKFIAEDSPDWPRAVALWRAQHRKNVGPPMVVHNGREGWYFPIAPLAADEGAKPSEAAE